MVLDRNDAARGNLRTPMIARLFCFASLAVAIAYHREKLVEKRRSNEISRLMKPVREAEQRALEAFKKWDERYATERGYGPKDKHP